MDQNQKIFMRNKLPTIDGPVMEVGSREYNDGVNFRGFYPDQPYVGIDMLAGPGVDIVADISKPDGADLGGPYALVICCAVLEHVERPWVFAENLSKLIRPGGRLYIAAPWVWRFHPYPDDYWRFSWRGVQVLFPDFEFPEAVFSTNVRGQFFRAVNGADDQLSGKGENGAKYLPYLMINLIGVKK